MVVQGIGVEEYETSCNGITGLSLYLSITMLRSAER